MSVNQLVPVSAPQRKHRFRGILYAGTLLIGGGVIGAVVVGPTLGQGPDGPRWQQRWNNNQDDDAAGRGPGQRGPRGFDMQREGRGGFGMRERGDDMRMGGGPRMGWRGGDGPGMGGRGFGGMLFPGAIERRVNRVLGLVDASTEQRQKVRSILEAAGNDLYPIHQQRMENRKQIGQALAAATIDRARIEELRQQQLKLNDAASKRMTDAITEAAEVLTPAQRAELAKRMERRQRG